MSTKRKSVKRWTPFARESEFEVWLTGELTQAGCTVFRQPVYMAASNHIPSGKYSPKLDLFVMVPPECNNLGRTLRLVVEIKNADNYSHLREAHRQVAAAMAGNDWRTAAKRGTVLGAGARPWRGLVITPGQLRRRLFVDRDQSTEEQRAVKPWAPELWELYDRQLWDDGASLLYQLAPRSFSFQAHIAGQIQMVTIRPPRVVAP